MALPEWARQDAGDEKFSTRGNVIARGISYNLIAAIFQIFGSLVSIIIMSRLLTPEDFGIHGMIMPFVTIFIMLADGGAVYYTLRLEQIREKILAHAFWYCAAIGTALMLLMFAVSPLIARLMDEPRLQPVAMVMGVAVFFAATGSQHMALIMRCFRNDLRTWVIAASVSLALLIAVIMAWAGWGYWALVMLLLMRTAFTAAFSVVMTGWRPSLPKFERPILREIAGLGSSEVSGRVLISGVREVDRILVGILFSTVVTGFYSLAYMLSTMPLLQLLTPIAFVILPFISEMKDDRDRLWNAVQLTLQGFIFVIAAWCVFASIYAEDLLRIFIGPEMLPTAEIFEILIISGMLTTLISFVSLPFQAVDRPDITRRHNFRMLYIFMVALAIGAYFAEPRVVAMAVLAANAVATVVRFVVLIRHFEQPWQPLVLGLLPVICFVILGPLAVWAVDVALLADAGMPHLLRMAILVLLFAAVQIAVGWRLFQPQIRNQFRKRLNKETT